MNEKEIIIAAMKSMNWTQATLAKQCGYKNQSGVSERLNGKSMRVDTFVKFLAAMGYEVVVKSASPNKNKNQWTISYDTPEDRRIPKYDLESLLSDESSPSSQIMKNGKITLV